MPHLNALPQLNNYKVYNYVFNTIVGIVMITLQLLMLILAKCPITHLLLYENVAMLALLNCLLANYGQLQCMHIGSIFWQGSVSIFLVLILLFLDSPTSSGVLQ